jgi:hypothetical protein
MDWLIKAVDSVYRAKISLDEHRSKMGQGPLQLIEALFAHLTGVYGTKELVNQYAAQVIATLEEFRGVSLLKLLTASLQSGFPFYNPIVSLICTHFTGRLPSDDV